MVSDNNFYREILDNLYDGVYFVDLARKITYWNKGAERLTGYQAGEVLGRCCSDNILMHMDQQGTNLCVGRCPLMIALSENRVHEAEVYLHHKEGHRLPVCVRVAPLIKEGKIIGAVEIFSDNTSKILALERIDELKGAIYTDPLTGVANRHFLEIYLATHLRELQDNDHSLAVVLMNIDQLDTVSGIHGDDVRDEVIQMVAKTLLYGSRSFDVVGRWDQDTFLLIMSNITEEKVEIVTNRLRLLIKYSGFSRGNQIIGVTASSGVTLAEAEDTEETLMQRADALMRQSQKTGGDRVSMG